MFRSMTWTRAAAACTLLLRASFAGRAEERTATFDADPGWDGHNNRSTAFEPRKVRQDFGYSPTSHAGGGAGEIGGFISPAAEPAYYARVIPRKTFDDKLSASGVLACDGKEMHLLIGFFNSRTINEWRTPNSMALRILGRGDHFFAFVEYATRLWRAGGDSPGGFATVKDPASGRMQLRGFEVGGKQHRWSLTYDPQANGGTGSMTVTLGGETAVCHLDPGHKADGAEFDRFGMLNVIKSPDGGGEVWLDDLTVLGETEHFDRDPGWDALGNRRTYVSASVRPRFDFGFSPTHHAGGTSAGEIGGLMFRGDCRYPERMGCYGDRLEVLTLEKPLRASGKVCLRRGVSDSTTLFGFYSSSESMKSNDSQSTGTPKAFLGVSIGGPSSQGFYFEPAYNTGGGGSGSPDPRPPTILPDGASHDWTLEYTPGAAGGKGRVVVTLDGKASSLDIRDGERPGAVRFDRFGFVTTWIDGNAQQVYLDDLTYTAKQ